MDECISLLSANAGFSGDVNAVSVKLDSLDSKIKIFAGLRLVHEVASTFANLSNFVIILTVYKVS